MALAIASPAQFSDQLLASIAQAEGLPPSQLQTPANEQVANTWYASEGGNWHNSALFNPLNTSLQEPGSVDFSTGRPGAGIQAYTSWDEGVKATVDTLLHSNPSYGYGAIVSDFNASAPPAQTARAIQISAWDAGGYPGSSAIGQLAGGGPPSPPQGASPATGGGTAQLTGLNANPFDLFGIPGTVGGAASDTLATGLKDVVQTFTAPLKKYLEDAALVVLGIVIVVVGLVVMAHAVVTVGSKGVSRASSGRSTYRQARSFAPKPTTSSEGAGAGAPEDAAAAA